MTFAQREIAAYAAEYTPDVADQIVDAVVTSVGSEITTDEARDILDTEQKRCDRRLHAYRPRRSKTHR
jgi:hypothetical protein